MFTLLEQAFVAAAARGDEPRADRLAAAVDAEQAAVEARLTAPGALLRAALWYAARGRPVFPCTPGGKRPVTRRGFHDATTEPDQIRAWWAATPDANVALPTGHTFDVFDLDGPEGLVALHEHMDRHAMPTLARSFTPRGRHYYVPSTGLRNRVRALPGVDYRGAGGYVVAPPSRSADGRGYRWLDGEALR